MDQVTTGEGYSNVVLPPDEDDLPLLAGCRTDTEIARRTRWECRCREADAKEALTRRTLQDQRQLLVRLVAEFLEREMLLLENQPLEEGETRHSYEAARTRFLDRTAWEGGGEQRLWELFERLAPGAIWNLADSADALQTRLGIPYEDRTRLAFRGEEMEVWQFGLTAHGQQVFNEARQWLRNGKLRHERAARRARFSALVLNSAQFVTDDEADSIRGHFGAIARDWFVSRYPDIRVIGMGHGKVRKVVTAMLVAPSPEEAARAAISGWDHQPSKSIEALMSACHGSGWDVTLFESRPGVAPVSLTGVGRLFFHELRWLLLTDPPANWRTALHYWEPRRERGSSEELMTQCG